jgi:pSer/pThr/pTyr-binding forkhead associated (FHA) protein
LTERNVSRDHGRIKRRRNSSTSAEKDTFVLEDGSSYNGLFVNGVRVATSQDLHHGDLVQIGDYRIVLQDDAAASGDSVVIPITSTDPGFDVKSTVPMAAAFRGQDLTERPSRFVMLVGPTPGVEYPLDRERLTIGRAEDASISVNHNSVSRLHCEVHALGDGRYEIVDKGSSNGVRVNGVELKRSIIEVGDVIELGDVRFKFVGAGQVFVPGPNESQQLTAISDRDAEFPDPRRKSWGGYAIPVMGAGVVGAAIILAFVYVLRLRAVADPAGIGAAPDAEQAALLEAKRTCSADECESYAEMLAKISEKSPWRSHADFKLVENLWADATFKKVVASTDVATKRSLLSRIAGATTLDDAHKARLLALQADLDAPPVVAAPSATTSASPSAVPVIASAVVSARNPPPHPPSSLAAPAPPASTKPPAGPSALERANEAATEGRTSEVRRLLEAKVRSGHGSPDEVRLVRKACSVPLDKACVEDIKAKYP